MKYVIKSVGKNMLNIPDRTETKNGVTMEVKNGVVHVYGDKKASGNTYFGTVLKAAYVKAGITYTLSQNITGTRGGVQAFCGVSVGAFNQEPNFWNATTKTMTASGWLQFLIYTNTTGYIDCYIRPQLEEGLTATSYEPFSVKNYVVDDSRLPVGYEELEYIESRGTQYIKTNIQLVGTETIKTKILLSNNTAERAALLGAGNTSNIEVFVSPSRRHYTFYTRINGSTESDVLFGKVAAITITPNKFEINGTSYYSSLYDRRYVYEAVNLSIFTNQYPAYGRIYYLTIDNSHNFIPCIRKSDNEVGMYDTVTNEFFTNQGTGYFIAGPKINNLREIIA